MENEQLQNPFRPGAGQRPPYLAGRKKEKDHFKKLLAQDFIMRNLVITGLRGTGKTVLLEELKPIALSSGWLWAGTELSESASVSEDTIAIRILTDLSILTSGLLSMKKNEMGFNASQTEKLLDYMSLEEYYRQQPGLVSDKLKATFTYIWKGLQTIPQVKGVVFAYDEAQEMNDQNKKKQFPLSVLLDVFQHVQRQGIPFILILAGLPTLYPKVVDTRGYSERMFDLDTLESLSEEESKEAISIPIKEKKSKMDFSEQSIKLITDTSGGYPYFIQFICRDAFDSFITQKSQGIEKPSVPLKEIIAKLDAEFFEPKWYRATDRERDLLALISTLSNCQEEFAIKEIMEQQHKYVIPKKMGDSQINRLLVSLAKKGLVFRTPRHGKYTLGIPMLGEYIQRQMPLSQK